MARLLCPKCNTTFSAVAGTQPVCPSCGYTTAAGVVASTPSPSAGAPEGAQPTYGTSFSYPGQPPPPAGGYGFAGQPQAAEGRPVIPADQQKTAPLAIAALVCSLLPFLLWFAAPAFGSEELFFVFGTFGFLGALLGIVFGAMALNQIKKDPYLKGRGLAMAGLVIGIVQMAITVITILVAVLFVAALAAACGGCSAPAGFVHFAHAAPPLSRRRRVAEFLLAHHPDCGLYESDVLRLGGVRLCVGCVAAGAFGTAALGALWLLGPTLPAWQWLVAGVLVGSAQFLSIAGWTRTRGRKVAVKAFMGVGAAAVGYALYVAPWPETVRVALLVVGGAFAIAFMVPRSVRMAKACEAHAVA